MLCWFRAGLTTAVLASPSLTARCQYIYQQPIMKLQAHSRATTFLTETKSRPQTSHIARNKSQLRQQFRLEPDIDPSSRLRQAKQQLRGLQNEYQSGLIRVNGSRKAIDYHYRTSQQRKVQFLNLYEHRRARLTEQQLLAEKQEEEDNAKAGLRERAKTMKLNGEIRSLLFRNEAEESNAQACSRNRLEKEKVRQELFRKREQDRQQAELNFARVKAGEGGLQEKLRRMGACQAALGRSNYLRKVGNEFGLVEQLDKKLGGSCSEACGDDCCEACLDQSPAFLTQK